MDSKDFVPKRGIFWRVDEFTWWSLQISLLSGGLKPQQLITVDHFKKKFAKRAGLFTGILKKYYKKNDEFVRFLIEKSHKSLI